MEEKVTCRSLRVASCKNVSSSYNFNSRRFLSKQRQRRGKGEGGRREQSSERQKSQLNRRALVFFQFFFVLFFSIWWTQWQLVSNFLVLRLSLGFQKTTFHFKRWCAFFFFFKKEKWDFILFFPRQINADR